MDVYFSPLACSLASRIVLYEAGADARFIEVDPKSKRTLDGADYREIYPVGLVPLLRLDDGSNQAYAGDIAAGAIQADDEPGRNRIAIEDADNRNRRRCTFGRER